MAQYDIKIPIEASTREIFFDRNTKKLSFKDDNGIITILDKDITIPAGFAFKNVVSENGTNIVGGSSVTAIRSVLIPANTLQNSVLDFGVSFAGQLNSPGVIKISAYLNTSDTLIGATKIAGADSTAIQFATIYMKRDLYFTNTDLFSYNTGEGFNAGYAVDQGASTATLSMTSNLYLIFTVQQTGNLIQFGGARNSYVKVTKS